MINIQTKTAFLKNFLQKMVFLAVKNTKLRKIFQRRAVFSSVRCLFQKPRGGGLDLAAPLDHEKKNGSYHFEEKSLNMLLALLKRKRSSSYFWAVSVCLVWKRLYIYGESERSCDIFRKSHIMDDSFF